jgi:hypothetical protein
MGVLEKEPPFYLGAPGHAQVGKRQLDLIQKNSKKCQVRSITGLKIEDDI